MSDAPDRAVETDHDQIYYASDDEPKSAFDMVADITAAAIPDDYDVVISGGEYRMHGVTYEVFPDEKVVHFDFYVTLFSGPQTGPKDEIIAELRDHFDGDADE